ncbi:MAG: UDP-N-acetylglucosamine 2-epimerase, partial [Candidatus Phaeomarinobacter sp.]
MIEVSRHIALVTTTRADWGILQPLAVALLDDPDIQLSIIAGGAHLSERHGMTVGEIEAAGFEIAARVPMPLEDDTARGAGHALGAACGGVADAFAALGPDLAIVLGDRFEILGAASAALM